MARPHLATLGLLVLVPYGLDRLAAPVEPLDPQRELASLVPAECLAYVESQGLEDLLRAGLDHPFVVELLASELGQAFLADAEASPRQLLAFADAVAGTPVLDALADVVSGGVALGVVPDEPGRLVLILRGSDSDETESRLHRAFDLLEAQIGQPGALDEPHRNLRGAEVWKVGEAFVARRDALIVLGSERGMLRDVLDLAADADAPGLAGDARFRRAYDRRRPDELFFAWADLGTFEETREGELQDLREAARNPGVHALLGPAVATLATADELVIHGRLDGAALELDVRGAGTEAASPLLPGARGQGGAIELSSPDDVANALLYRDYAALFQHRVELFPPESLPAFAKTISDMGLFFGGRDIGEDVLPHVSPWIRLVSRPVDFAEGVRPEIPLPALAAVAAVEDGATGNDFITAFQTLISILNVDQAQKSGRMMQLSLGLEGDVQITSASYPPPGPEDGVDVSYNLRPACALVGRHLVLGTHVDLVRALVRELSKGSGAATVARESLRLDGPAVAAVVEDNFEALVMNKVLEDGVTREEAEEEIGGLRLLAASLREVGFATAHPAADEVELSLSIRLGEEASR